MIYYVRILWYSYFISFNFIWSLPILWKYVKSEAKPSSWSFSGFAWELARGVTQMDQILLVSPCSTLSSAEAETWQCLQAPCCMHVSMVSGIRYYVVCADLSTTLSLSVYLHNDYCVSTRQAGRRNRTVQSLPIQDCSVQILENVPESTSIDIMRPIAYVYVCVCYIDSMISYFDVFCMHL